MNSLKIRVKGVVVLGIKKILLFLLLFLMPIFLGIWLPVVVLGEHIILMQILFTIVLLGPLAYLSLKLAIMNDKLKKRISRNKSIREATLNLYNELIEHSFSDEVYALILKNAINLLNADRGCVAIINKNKDIEYKAWIGYGEGEKIDIKFPVISGEVEGVNQKTQLCTPLYLADQLLGYLYVERMNRENFDGEDVRIMNYFGDLSGNAIDIHKLVDGISHLARYDDLTNTFNRRHFIEMFTNACSETYMDGQEFSLVYFDIDNLKVTNDQFGHHYGDKVIKVFSKVIQENIRDTDLFSRYGGDEFVAVLFNMDKERVRERIQNIERQLKEKSIFTKNGKIHVKFSYGIANYPEDAKDLDQLIQIADRRMYIQKEHLKSGA